MVEFDGITELPIYEITKAVFQPIIPSSPSGLITQQIPIFSTPGGQVEVNPYPAKFPKLDLKAADKSAPDDKKYYANPRLEYYADPAARTALTNFYREFITEDGLDILDIGSSWVSHYPEDFKTKMKSIVGTGMNADEMKQNTQLSSNKVADLNDKDPTKTKLPFEDASFDVVTCAMSVEYFTNPVEVFKEANRVLKPGGKLLVAESNRATGGKTVKAWQNLDTTNQLRLVGQYFNFGGNWAEPRAFDVTPVGPKARDGMYIVGAKKVSKEEKDATDNANKEKLAAVKAAADKAKADKEALAKASKEKGPAAERAAVAAAPVAPVANAWADLSAWVSK